MKETLIVAIIEAFVFAFPFFRLWFQVGSWKREVELKIQETRNDVSEVVKTFNRIDRLLQENCQQLAVISAKVSLIIDDKIKIEK